MARVAARLVEWDEPPFPGVAHVVLTLADGGVVDLWDEMPVLGIGSGMQVGDTVPLACDVVELGATVVTVRLRHGVSSPDGRSTFAVSATVVDQR